MSTVLLDPRTEALVASGRPAEHQVDPERDGRRANTVVGRSLDEWMTALWSELESGRPAPCPACGGAIRTLTTNGAFEALCVRCGSTLG
jgi:hypothetical protein